MSFLDPVQLRARRIAAGLSMSELGRRAGIDKPSISVWERGLGSVGELATYYDLAGVLGCAVDDLLLFPLAHGRGKLGARYPRKDRTRLRRMLAKRAQWRGKSTQTRNELWMRRLNEATMTEKALCVS